MNYLKIAFDITVGIGLGTIVVFLIFCAIIVIVQSLNNKLNG